MPQIKAGKGILIADNEVANYQKQGLIRAEPSPMMNAPPSRTKDTFASVIEYKAIAALVVHFFSLLNVSSLLTCRCGEFGHMSRECTADE